MPERVVDKKRNRPSKGTGGFKQYDGYRVGEGRCWEGVGFRGLIFA